MNILVLNTYKTWGGGETWMLDIAEGLKARGHACYIVGNPQYQWYKRSMELGWNPIAINITGEFVPTVWYNLHNLYSKLKIDIVLCNFDKEARIAAFARGMKNTPKIINLKGLPLMSDNLRYKLSYKYLIDHTVVCASFIKDEFKRFDWLNQNNITVIYNSYKHKSDLNFVSSFRNEFNIPSDNKIVGAVARFDFRKGLQDLISAIPTILLQNPKTTFVIVGDGAEKENLTKMVEELNISGNVVFTGFRKDLEAIFPEFNIFVLPSHNEGFPYVTQIAMAHKNAVVATNVDGIPDLVKDNENGLLINPRRPSEIAEKVIYLLNNMHLAQQLGNNAYNDIVTKFSYNTMIDKFENLFKNICNY